MTNEIETNNLINEVLTDLNKKFRQEKIKDKQIRQNNKGLFLLWDKGLNQVFKKIAPYYLIKEIDKLFYFGAMGLRNKRELTKQEHKDYFKLIDKQKKINKRIEKFKRDLK